MAALQWAGQLLCLLLRIRVPEAWIKNEGFIAPLRHVGSAAPGWASRCCLYSKVAYEDAVLPTGAFAGLPEDALDCAAGLYLNDPTL